MRFARRALQRPRGLDGRDDEPPRPPRGGRPHPPCPRPGGPAGRQDRAHRRRQARVDGVDERAGPQGGPRRLGADEARADAAELAAAQTDARVRALARHTSVTVPGTGRVDAGRVATRQVWISVPLPRLPPFSTGAGPEQGRHLRRRARGGCRRTWLARTWRRRSGLDRRGAQAGVAFARAERVEGLRLAPALDAVGDVLGERRPVLEPVT